MSKRALSGMILVLLSTSMFFSTFDIKSVKAKSNPVFFAAYMPFWGMNMATTWGNISQHGVFKPLLGDYRSDNSTIADSHIEWALEYGINCFVIDWGWFGPSSPADRAICEGFLKASSINKINFTLDYFLDRLYWAFISDPQLNLTSFIIQDFTWIVDHYLKHPSYYKTDGKRILFMVGMYRFEPSIVIKLIEDLRLWLYTDHGIELYIIGDIVWPGNSTSLLETYNRTFDAVFKLGEVGFVFSAHGFESGTYPYDENIDLANETYFEWYPKALSKNIGFVPSVTPGFNNTIIYKSGVNDRLWIIPRNKESFTNMLQVALNYVDPNLNIIYLHTWNDFQEGTSTEPTYEYGFEYLEAILPLVASFSVSISPLPVSINVGQSVTFTSTVSGGYPPYTYQWYLNGNPVSGATSGSWTFTPTASGIYYVYLKVTDAKGNTAQSQTARITAATVPVGGYSIPIQLPTITKPATIHIALLTILTIAFTTIKHKTTRKKPS